MADNTATNQSEVTPHITYTKKGKLHNINQGFTITDILAKRHTTGLPWNSKDGNDIATEFGLTYPTLTALRESPEWKKYAELFAEENEVPITTLGIKDAKQSRRQMNAPFRVENAEELKLGHLKGRTGNITKIHDQDHPNREIGDNTDTIVVVIELSEPIVIDPSDMSRSQLLEEIDKREKELERIKSENPSDDDNDGEDLNHSE